MANGDMPTRVADATKIESVWGNSVVDNLSWQRNRTAWTDFIHQGGQMNWGGVVDMGACDIPAVNYPRRLTIMCVGYFGFATGRVNARMDLYRYFDGATNLSPGQESTGSSWTAVPFRWTYTVAPGQLGSFKSRMFLDYLENGVCWYGSHGAYHEQRYGTP